MNRRTVQAPNVVCVDRAGVATTSANRALALASFNDSPMFERGTLANCILQMARRLEARNSGAPTRPALHLIQGGIV